MKETHHFAKLGKAKFNVEIPPHMVRGLKWKGWMLLSVAPEGEKVVVQSEWRAKH